MMMRSTHSFIKRMIHGSIIISLIILMHHNKNPENQHKKAFEGDVFRSAQPCLKKEVTIYQNQVDDWWDVTFNRNAQNWEVQEFLAYREMHQGITVVGQQETVIQRCFVLYSLIEAIFQWPVIVQGLKRAKVTPSWPLFTWEDVFFDRSYFLVALKVVSLFED